MNWKVTYRGNDGKTVNDIFESESREALFKVLAAKGIHAIRVEAAGTKSIKRKKGSSAGMGVIKGAIAGLVVIAAAAAWFFYVSRPNDVASKRSGNAGQKIAEVKPSLSTNNVATSGLTTDSTKESIPAENDLPPNKRIVEYISVITNADGSVLERFRTADGKTRSRQSAPKPVFDNASDQIIAMAVTGAASGGSMPPMPVMNNADDEFLKSLEKEIVINDDDSDAVKELKREVMEVRAEMLKLLSEGHTFEEVIKDHRDEVNHRAEIRKEANRLINEFLENGEYEMAQECLEKFNEALRGMGIEEVSMPLSREERREQIRERNMVR